MERRRFFTVASTVTIPLMAGCMGSTDDSNDTGTGDNGDDTGGTNNENANSEDDTDGENESDNDALEEPDSIEFSGSGQDVTETFTIEGGMTAFDFSHTGSSNFQVELIDDGDGETAEYLVNEIGEYKGRKAIGLPASEYLLDITADGEWSVTIEQPRPADSDVEGLPVDLEDAGADYFGPYAFDGRTRIDATHDGESNFQVLVLNAEGSWVKLAFNEIGSFEGLTTFDHSGTGWLVVEADGEWTLALE